MDSRAAEVPQEERYQISSVGIDATTPPNLSTMYQNILAAMLSVMSTAVAQGFIKLHTDQEIAAFVKFVEQQILYRTQLVFDYTYFVNGGELLIVIGAASHHGAFGYTTQ